MKINGDQCVCSPAPILTGWALAGVKKMAFIGIYWDFFSGADA